MAELTRAQRIFDPASLVAVVPGHGTVASRLDDASVTLSCAKSVEHRARALVLLVPDLMRIDVRPYADSVAVLVRLQADDVVRFMRSAHGQSGWRAGDEGPSSDADDVRLYVELPEVAVLVEMLLRTHPHASTHVTHVSSRVLLTRIEPDQMRPIEPEK